MSDNPGDNTPVDSADEAAPGNGSNDIAIEVDTSEAAALGTAGTVAPADDTHAADSDAARDGAITRIAELEAEKAKLEEEKQDFWNRLLRATADLDNFRKRARREADEARYEARTKVLKEMLPVIDNLERAVDHAVSQGSAETGIIEGVQLVLRQFAQALERCEVVPVDAQGKPFDPNVHEALSQAVTSEHPPGSVVQVLQRGYKIGERLLRPALVVVAKAPPEPAPEPAAASADGSGQSSDAGPNDVTGAREGQGEA